MTRAAGYVRRRLSNSRGSSGVGPGGIWNLTGLDGSGRDGSGRDGSGRFGSGRVGSGRVGSGRVGSGQEDL